MRTGAGTCIPAGSATLAPCRAGCSHPPSRSCACPRPSTAVSAAPRRRLPSRRSTNRPGRASATCRPARCGRWWSSGRRPTARRPEGSSYQSGQGCLADVSAVRFPAGMSFKPGEGCVASAPPVSCPPGSSHQEGRGCVGLLSPTPATTPDPFCKDTCNAVMRCVEKRFAQRLPASDWEHCRQQCGEHLSEDVTRWRIRGCLTQGCAGLRECLGVAVTPWLP